MQLDWSCHMPGTISLLMADGVEGGDKLLQNFDLELLAVSFVCSQAEMLQVYNG